VYFIAKRTKILFDYVDYILHEDVKRDLLLKHAISALNENKTNQTIIYIDEATHTNYFSVDANTLKDPLLTYTI
jgi:hypothetical protein